MKRHVLILGAGFGGLELATRLSAIASDAVDVTLLDRNDSFFFGFLEARGDARPPVGRRRAAAVPRYCPGRCRVLPETVVGVDPGTRRVHTDVGTHHPAPASPDSRTVVFADVSRIQPVLG